MDKSPLCGSGAPGSEGSRDRPQPAPPWGSVSPKATSMGDQTAMIKDTDMSEEVQQDAVECAILAIEKYNVEREIAALIKRVNVGLVCPFVEHDLLQKLSREFEKKYSPTRRCIVGRKFGSYVSYETKHFIFFPMHGVNIVLFKAG